MDIIDFFDSWKIYIFLNFLDVVSTVLNVSKFGIEAELNPIPKIFGWEFFIALKVIVCIAVAFVWEFWGKKYPDKIIYRKFTFFVVNMFYIFVVIWNFTLFLIFP